MAQNDFLLHFIHQGPILFYIHGLVCGNPKITTTTATENPLIFSQETVVGRDPDRHLRRTRRQPSFRVDELQVVGNSGAEDSRDVVIGIQSGNPATESIDILLSYNEAFVFSSVP